MAGRNPRHTIERFTMQTEEFVEVTFNQEEIGISVSETFRYLSELVASGEVEEGSFIFEVQGVDLEVTIKPK
jgi:hypothetical protein